MPALLLTALRAALPYLLAAGVALGAWGWVSHQVTARRAAQARAAAAEAQAQAAGAAIAALEARAVQAEAAQARSADLRRAAHASPATTACVGSPAVAGYLRGLRGPPLAVVVPETLRRCAAEPAPPAMAADADLVDWIEDVRAAGDDCRRTLAAVVTLLPR